MYKSRWHLGECGLCVKCRGILVSVTCVSLGDILMSVIMYGGMCEDIVDGMREFGV